MTDATIAGFSHGTVMVDDLDAALDFYRGVLGFHTLPRPEGIGPGAWLQAGTAQVHLGVVDAMITPAGLPHLALLVTSDTWDATMQAITDAGVEFMWEPIRRPDGQVVHTVFVRDPAGNVIELTDRDPAASAT
jgi:glyoxylase I family protein